MSEEPKNVRLPIMVTESEAKAIDDWRFEHRISTRAEAMRQLLGLGLSYETQRDKLSEAARLAVLIARDAGMLDEYWEDLDRILDIRTTDPKVMKDALMLLVRQDGDPDPEDDPSP